MNPNRFAVAALGFTCVAAAAGGGYLASRQHAAVQPAEAAAVTTTPASAEPGKAAVSETEAIVGDVKPDKAAAPRPATERSAAARAASSPSRPARRADTTSPRTSAPASGSAWPVSVPSGFPSNSGASQPVGEPNQASTPVADNQPQEPVRVPDPPKAPVKEFAELVV